MTAAQTKAPSAKEAAPGSVWAHVLKTLLAPAVVLALLMLALEKHRALDFLDVIGLRLAAPLQVLALEPTQTVDFRVIDVDTYVRDFGGSSPLNPAVLAPWLQHHVPRQYGALMIDLQLEPWPGQDRQGLDAWLMQQAATGRLVLPLPQLGWTREVHERSYAWMKAMCAAGASFADPRLREHQGWVVRLDLLPHTLAQVTRAVRQGHGPGSDAHAPICEAAQLLPDLESLYAHLDADAESLDLHDTAPLRPALVSALVKRSTEPRAPAMDKDQCRSCVIAIGGSYEASDRFRVPSLRAPVNGVIVHATAVLKDSQMRSSTLLNVALDIALGVAVGWLLAKHEPRRPWRWLAPLLIGALTVTPLVLAGALLNLGLWANPLPMVLGMWLHAKAEPLVHRLAHRSMASGTQVAHPPKR